MKLISIWVRFYVFSTVTFYDAICHYVPLMVTNAFKALALDPKSKFDLYMNNAHLYISYPVDKFQHSCVLFHKYGFVP